MITNLDCPTGMDGTELSMERRQYCFISNIFANNPRYGL